MGLFSTVELSSKRQLIPSAPQSGFSLKQNMLGSNTLRCSIVSHDGMKSQTYWFQPQQAGKALLSPKTSPQSRVLVSISWRSWWVDHTSLFPGTECPFQRVHMDLWSSQCGLKMLFFGISIGKKWCHTEKAVEHLGWQVWSRTITQLTKAIFLFGKSISPSNREKGTRRGLYLDKDTWHFATRCHSSFIFIAQTKVQKREESWAVHPSSHRPAQTRPGTFHLSFTTRRSLPKNTASQIKSHH